MTVWSDRFEDHAAEIVPFELTCGAASEGGAAGTKGEIKLYFTQEESQKHLNRNIFWYSGQKGRDGIKGIGHKKYVTKEVCRED